MLKKLQSWDTNTGGDHTVNLRIILLPEDSSHGPYGLPESTSASSHTGGPIQAGEAEAQGNTTISGDIQADSENTCIVSPSPRS